MTAELDIDAVGELLRERLGPNVVCSEVRRGSIGNSQETWFLNVTGLEPASDLVLRRSAAGGTLEWSDRGREVVALGAARAAGLPVPIVHWWAGEGTELERPYIVMERAPGAPPDMRRGDICDRLAVDLGTWLARLHNGAVVPRELALRGGAGSSAEQLQLWTERARGSGLAPPIVMALFGWLAARVPPDPDDAVLLWGDPGPHNLLTDQDGRITALLDWELAHVGHPLEDLGAARWSCLGQLDRESVTIAYELEWGTPIDRRCLAWFEVLACLSRSVMLFDGVRAAIEGRSNDTNMVALGLALVSANLLRAVSLAWGIEAKPLASPVGVNTSAVGSLRPTETERIEIVGRFLTEDLLPHVGDERARRGLKVAVALLASAIGPGGASTPSVKDGEHRAAAHDDWYERERDGRATAADRQQLVASLVAERAAQDALVTLYGPTTAVADF